MSFNPDSYGLLFNKPVFDMAFILTHENLTLNITKFQKHFQSKLRFTTHCILIEDASKIGVCLRDLKTQNISYAIILREHSENLNSYDLYVLHRNEVQTNITMEKVDFLVCNDFNNLMNQIKLVKKNPLKCPHLPPNDEKFVNMDDEIRYYFCLLFDNRVLTKSELEQVNRYLLLRKMKLEGKTNSGFQPVDETPDIIRPSKFVFKGPNNAVSIMPITSINDEPTTTNFTTYKADMEIVKPISIIKDRKKSKFGPIVNPTIIGGKDNVVIEKPAIRYSDGKDNSEKSKSSSKKSSSDRRSDSKHSNKHDSKRSRLDSGSRSRGSSRRDRESSPSHRNHDTKHSADESRSSGASSRKQQTESSASGRVGTISDPKPSKSSKIKFSFIKSKAQSGSKTPSKKSRSPSKQHPQTEIVIKFPDGKALPAPPPSILWPNSNPTDPEIKQSAPPVDQSLGDADFIDLTDDFDESTSAMTTDFRKGPVIDIDIQTAKFLRPHDNLNTVRDFIHTIPPANQSSPDSLLNLFRLVLNLVPLGLPNDNVVYKILSNSCLVIQNGIKEPALKNVKINYTTCKTNGLTEVIANIYSIYNESLKDVNDTSYMAFIWNAYFPDHVSNFNLIILFYRFVKLLMLYTIFNKANVTKRLVWNVIEQVDVVVSFDFYCHTSYNQGHLSCFSKTFDKYFKEHDQLHVLYSKLPNPNALPLTDKRKKLDSVIKKKKISFTIGPLLNYFVNSVNFIHRKMQPIQIEIIYGAVRTLRFCLRKINPQLVHTTFNNPKTFNFDFGKSTNHDNEILRELKILLGEIKSYQCVLFTEMHYEFINCLLDFAWMVEGTIDTNSDAFKATTRADTLIYLDPEQFVDGFASYENPISLLYHPDSELEHLKNSLKKHWTDVLHQAFVGTQPEPCGWRMVKEMGILLPNSWGEIIFNEAVSEASRLYYADFTRLGNNPSTANCKNYSQSKSSGIEWLTKYRLPTANLSALRQYQQTLDKEMLLRKP